MSQPQGRLLSVKPGERIRSPRISDPSHTHTQNCVLRLQPLASAQPSPAVVPRGPRVASLGKRGQARREDPGRYMDDGEICVMRATGENRREWSQRANRLPRSAPWSFRSEAWQICNGVPGGKYPDVAKNLGSEPYGTREAAQANPFNGSSIWGLFGFYIQVERYSFGFRRSTFNVVLEPTWIGKQQHAVADPPSGRTNGAE